MHNIKPSKLYANAGYVAPVSVTDSTANTGSTYLTVPQGAKWAHLRLSCGAGAGSVAVTANQATAAAGTGTKAFTLSPTITGIVTGSHVTTYEYDLSGLDINNGFAFLQFVLTVTGTLIVGLDVSFGPATYLD